MVSLTSRLKGAVKARLTPEQWMRLGDLNARVSPIAGVQRLARAVRQSANGYHWVPDIYGRSAAKQLDIREEEPFGSLARQAVETGRAMLYYDRLHVLYQALRNVTARLGPDETLTTMEVGVYKGGGSYFLASVANQLAPGRARHFAVDTFEGHSQQDLASREGWHEPGSFVDTDFDAVRGFLSRWPFVEVLRGRIQDFEARLGPERFHFIHLDVDIYQPTRYALDLYSERLVPGGVIVVDDYGFRSCPGIKQAVAEFIVKGLKGFTMMELPSGQCFLTRLC